MSHVRIEIRCGEECLPDPTQRQVECREHVEVVPADGLLDTEVRERKRQQQLQRCDKLFAVIVEGFGSRIQILEVFGEVHLSLRQHV